MSTQDNKTIVRRWNEELWKGNQAVFEELLAPDCVFHAVGGPLEIRKTVENIREAFANIQFRLVEQIAEDDKVVTRWTLSGDHRGRLWGVSPTGNRISYSGITINRIADGKICEEWCELDLFGLMQQIGAVPTMGSTDEWSQNRLL
jgi:steroid delta-isomerase-like uncharacterized protein